MYSMPNFFAFAKNFGILVNSNNSICKSTTYLIHSDLAYFTLTPTYAMLRVTSSGRVGGTDYTASNNDVLPCLLCRINYIKSIKNNV